MFYGQSKQILFLYFCQELCFRLFFISIFILTCFYVLTIDKDRKPTIINGHTCFQDQHLGKELDSFRLEDILLSKRKPTKDKTIFFHETSCSQTGKLKLSRRAACAIESAAFLNPNFDIFVLFASPTVQWNESLSKNIFHPQEILKLYPNIYLRNVNLWSYAVDTPLQDWIKQGRLLNSKYILSHVSDFLRYLTLWRWGGTHMDLDFILKKSLESFKPNYAGAEDEYIVAAGILNLDKDGIGHQIADMCLTKFRQYFDGNDWSKNGPVVITRVLRELCNVILTESMSRSRCAGFKVFGKKAFYALEFQNWKYYFEKQYLQAALNTTEESIGIHVWNSYSKQFVIKVGAEVAYGIYAKKYCPKVYSSCGKYF